MLEYAVFYLFATVSIVAALVVVLQQRAVYSVLALIVCFGSMSVLFFQLGAPFLAAIQVIVYAGAIMVLFLFVTMLLDPESEQFPSNRLRKTSILSLPLAAFLAFLMFQAMRGFFRQAVETENLALAPTGETADIARLLFRDYLLPFEATSILVLAAILGAVVLAKRPE